MRFKRTTHLTPPAAAGVDDPELIVSDSGFCWRKLGEQYVGEGFLQDPGCRLIDVSGPPLHSQGNPGDAALCPDDRFWKKNDGGDWIFQGYVVAPEIEDLTVNGFRVDGNLSLPLVAGKIPLYNRQGTRIGNLIWEPISPSDPVENT